MVTYLAGTGGTALGMALVILWSRLTGRSARKPSNARSK